MSMATIMQIKKFFDMSAKQMLSEWQKLSKEEQLFFRIEVGKLSE